MGRYAATVRIRSEKRSVNCSFLAAVSHQRLKINGSQADGFPTKSGTISMYVLAVLSCSEEHVGTKSPVI